MEEFGYEKLDVYKCSMEFLESAFALIEKLPKGFAHLGDQLKRASLSIPLNFAEGSGKSAPAERRRFYEIARASALECSAIVSCARTLKIVEYDLTQKNRILIFRIVQMLSKLTDKHRLR